MLVSIYSVAFVAVTDHFTHNSLYLDCLFPWSRAVDGCGRETMFSTMDDITYEVSVAWRREGTRASLDYCIQSYYTAS